MNIFTQVEITSRFHLPKKKLVDFMWCRHSWFILIYENSFAQFMNKNFKNLNHL